MVNRLRLDTNEVSNQIRKSIEKSVPKKRAHLRPDGKGRIKERCRHIFAVTSEEFIVARARVDQARGGRNLLDKSMTAIS